MSNSSDRFYLLEFRNRPVFMGDIGSLLRISGLYVEGNGVSAVLLLPSHNLKSIDELAAYPMDLEQWSDFIHRSDDPEILVGNSKIFQRKVRWEISGAVQQKVWAADGFKCMYCGARMGNVLMTIDHFVPLELGGENNEKNYLSSCRKCNKDKGSEDAESWCARKDIKFGALKQYLANRHI